MLAVAGPTIIVGTHTGALVFLSPSLKFRTLGFPPSTASNGISTATFTHPEGLEPAPRASLYAVKVQIPQESNEP